MKALHSALLSTTVALAGTLAAGGCALHDVGVQSAELIEMMRPFLGTITVDGTGRSDGNIVVVIYAGSGPNTQVQTYRAYPAPGRYGILMLPGTYRIAAFDDVDRDWTYDAGEAFGRYNGGELLEGGGGEPQWGADFDLTVSDGDVDFPDGLRIDDRTAHPALAKRQSAVRIIENLDHKAFSKDAADAGTWRPKEFLENHGAALYCFGAPDQARIPVVFVHGANGTPRDWAAVIEHVDETRYQVWLYDYPTALSLRLLGWHLSSMLTEASLRYELKPWTIAAHSMGGLVSRAALNWQHNGGREGFVDRFITVATPFGGHPGAALGDAWAPYLVPYWRDLAPGSKFLTWLHAQPLPDHVRHYMVLAIGGEQSSMMPVPNDGSVPLASQSDMRAQRHVRNMRAIALGHDAILEQPDGREAFFLFLAHRR